MPPTADANPSLSSTARCSVIGTNVAEAGTHLSGVRPARRDKRHSVISSRMPSGINPSRGLCALGQGVLALSPGDDEDVPRGLEGHDLDRFLIVACFPQSDFKCDGCRCCIWAAWSTPEDIATADWTSSLTIESLWAAQLEMSKWPGSVTTSIASSLYVGRALRSLHRLQLHVWLRSHLLLRPSL